jgi:hypothetical protein
MVWWRVGHYLAGRHDAKKRIRGRGKEEEEVRGPTFSCEDAGCVAKGMFGFPKANLALLGLIGELGLDLREENASVGQRKVGLRPVLLHVPVVVVSLLAIVQQLHEEVED